MGGRLVALGLALVAVGLVLVWSLAAGREHGRAAAAPFRGKPDPAPLREPRPPVEAAAAQRPAPAAEAGRAAVAPIESAAILGTVQDEAGQPVAGARVTLFDGALFGPGRLRSPEPAAEHVTGPDGRFRFSVPSADEPRGVRVRASGFAARGRNQSQGVDVPFELTPAARLIGRLVGEGATGTRVFTSDRDAVQGGSTRVDDGRGTFTVDGLPTGEAVEFLIAPPDALPFEVTFTLPGPGVHEREVDLGASGAIAGRVIDVSTGNPVAGAVLRDPRADETALVTTDESGGFALSVRGASAAAAPGSARVPATLEVLAPGFLTSIVISTLPAHDATLRLVRGGRVRGVVHEVDGSPAAGALVAWTAPVQLMGAQEFLTMPAPARAVTDDHGRFALEGVPWGVDDGVLEVSGPGWRFQAVGSAPVDPWTPRELDLRVPAGRTVHVRVRWRGFSPDVDLLRARLHGVEPVGWPAPRVVVVATDGSGTERARAATDAQGRARLEGLPGGELWLSLLDRPEDPTAITDDAAVVELEVQPPMHALRVRVRDWDGAALPADAFVSVVAGRPGPGLRHHGATRGADGIFELSWCAFETEPRLCVRVDGNELERAAVPGELDWDLPRRLPVRIEGVTAAERRVAITWHGPGAGLAGHRFLLAAVGEGGEVSEATLPCGPLELEVGTQRASVIVAPGTDGETPVLRLSR